jgi:hypothetical protein
MSLFPSTTLALRLPLFATRAWWSPRDLAHRPPHLLRHQTHRPPLRSDRSVELFSYSQQQPFSGPLCFAPSSLQPQHASATTLSSAPNLLAEQIEQSRHVPTPVPAIPLRLLAPNEHRPKQATPQNHSTPRFAKTHLFQTTPCAAAFLETSTTSPRFRPQTLRLHSSRRPNHKQPQYQALLQFEQLPRCHQRSDSSNVLHPIHRQFDTFHEGEAASKQKRG